MRLNIYAPKQQQLEGMKFVLDRIGFRQYCLSLAYLRSIGFLSKSKCHKRIKQARHLMGISYEDYLARYKVI